MKIISIIPKVKTQLLRWVSWLGAISLKSVLIFISLQFVLFAVAFVVLGLLPVNREVRSITKNLNVNQSQNQVDITHSKINLAHKLVEAEHQEAFLKAHLEFSKADSMSLLIDLKDSLAILTFKGVFLLKSKISNIDFNKGLGKMPLFLLDSLFSGPYMVQRELATIEKFPIVIKKAPKDTLEANLLNSAPEHPKQKDVFWFFTLSNNFAVEIRQQEDDLIGARSEYRNFLKSKARFSRGRSLHSIFKPEENRYTYKLSIEIPREDARSIYRALPIKPVVVVRY
jgi:hypothetical protein